jgi:hypothetical protein
MEGRALPPVILGRYRKHENREEGQSVSGGGGFLKEKNHLCSRKRTREIDPTASDAVLPSTTFVGELISNGERWVGCYNP